MNTKKVYNIIIFYIIFILLMFTQDLAMLGLFLLHGYVLYDTYYRKQKIYIFKEVKDETTKP